PPKPVKPSPPTTVHRGGGFHYTNLESLAIKVLSNHTFNVESLSIQTTITATGQDNSFNIGGDTTDTSHHNLETILGDLTLTGGGRDKLTINDQNNPYWSKLSFVGRPATTHTNVYDITAGSINRERVPPLTFS